MMAVNPAHAIRNVVRSPASMYEDRGTPRCTIMRRPLLLLFMALLLASCASSNHVRKCNGHRGIRVPMGVI
jgi:hypothetical protein